jgi:hypothetical protein
MRRAVLSAGLALGLALLVPGCSFFRAPAQPGIEPVVPDSTQAATPTPAPVRPPAARPVTPPVEQPPTTPAPAVPDTTAVQPGRPVLTVRMSAQEETAFLARLKGDMDRASEALAFVRRQVLSGPQAEQVVVAEKFLKDAEAARGASDLQRACTLAEKARILAEELKSAVRR